MNFKIYKGVLELVLPFHFAMNGSAFCIPAGFKTDGLSIPRFVYSLKIPFIELPFPFDPRYIEEAIKHDYIYKEGLLTRKIADKALKQGLRESGCGVIASQMIYLAVRLFGGFNYNKGK